MYVILLDCYDGKYGDDQYAVTASGSLAECRAITRHDENTTPAPIADYTAGPSEPTSLLDPMGVPNPGVILQLTPKADQ